MTIRPSAWLAATMLPALAQPSVAAPSAAATFDQTATVERAEGRANFDDVVACFRTEARMPSFAHIATYPAAGEAIYRLRFDGLMFETIRFFRSASGGTSVEIRLADSLSGAERRHFRAVRGASLARCLERMPMLVDGGPIKAEAGL